MRIPGNPFAPLSYLSFSVPPLADDLQPYNPDRDLQQLGEGFEVVPVPFTVTPLGILERLRTEIGKRTTWHGVRFDESKWAEQLVSDMLGKLGVGELTWSSWQCTRSCSRSISPSLSTRQRSGHGAIRSSWTHTRIRYACPEQAPASISCDTDGADRQVSYKLAPTSRACQKVSRFLSLRHKDGLD